MKLRLILISAFVAAVAWAGSRAADSSGGTPSATTDGVTLLDSTGCRVSIRARDGGTINGGTLAMWYYDSVLGWTRSATSLDCTLEANKLIDGGAPTAQVCPDYQPMARFGRIAVEARNIVGADGGTPNGIGTDGGANVTPLTRVECWGPEIP